MKTSSLVLFVLALSIAVISAPLAKAQTRGLIAWSGFGSPEVLDPVPVEPDAIAALRNGTSFLVLRADGTVVEHGGGFKAPTGLASVTQIAAGNTGGLVLHQNGTVTGWGAAAGLGTGVTDGVQVAAGPEHFIILRGTGKIKAKGTLIYSQWVPVPGSPFPVRASAYVPPALPALTHVDCTVSWAGGITAGGKVIRWGYSDLWKDRGDSWQELDPWQELSTLHNSWALELESLQSVRDLIGSFPLFGSPGGDALKFQDAQSIALASSSNIPYTTATTGLMLLRRNGTVTRGGNVLVLAENPVIAALSNAYGFPAGVTGIASLPPVFVSPAAAVVLGDASTVPADRVWYQCAAANVPQSFSSTTLPPGLSMDAQTGRVSGQPNAIGIYDVTFTASNAAGQGQKIVKFYVNYSTAPQVNSGSRSIPQNTEFIHGITPDGTAGPLSFEASNLPAGLVFEASTGIIRGSVAVTGTYRMLLKVTRGVESSSGTLELTVTAAVPVVKEAQVTVRQGAWFYHQITATGIPHSGFASTELPPGLSLARDGAVSGRIETPGEYAVTLFVTNAVGTGKGVLHVRVLPAAAVPRLTVTTIVDELDTPAGSAVSLREAIRVVPAGGVVHFAPALLGQTFVLTRGALSVAGKEVTVAAAVPGVTISGKFGRRILEVAGDSSVSLEGLTLRDGRAPSGTGTATQLAHGGHGGAILCQGLLVARDCRFTGNSAGEGGEGQTGESGKNGQRGGDGGSGGAVWSAGRVEMQRCTFTVNQAGAGGGGGRSGDDVGWATYPGVGGAGGSGGAIFAAEITLTDCMLTGNGAGNGGQGAPQRGAGPQDVFSGDGGTGGSGGAVSCGVATLQRSTFVDNIAGGYGWFGGEVFFAGRDGGPGSGGAVFASSASLTNCTLTGNKVLEAGPRTPAARYSRGGAIAATSGMALHCTISGNSIQGTYMVNLFVDPAGTQPKDGRGGGIAAGSGFTITNCIIAGNTAIFPEENDLNGGVTLTGANLIGVSGNTAGPLNGTVAAPLAAGLAAPAWNGGSVRTMRLLPGSPALNAALPGSALPATDQRGYPRTSGASPDLGALEMEATTLPGLVVRDLSITPAGDGFLLRWGITAGSYTIEQSTTLLPQSWSPVPGVTPVLDAVEASAQATIPGNGSLQRYFRVRWNQ